MSGTSLRVGLVAPPWVPIPPRVYGGTELVLDHLARGLVRAGHDVHLFTTGDSTCAVRRSFRLAVAAGTTGGITDELAHVEGAYAEFTDRDVIHDHTLLGPLWAIANGIETPIVTTAHGAFTQELTELYAAIARNADVVAISQHQRSTAPEVPVTAVILHGLDIADVPVGTGDGGYVLFLGRMHPDKGVHRAIAVARAAGKRLLIAAKMWEPVEHHYFAEVVEPLLADDAVFLGPVDLPDKLDLLCGAEALLNPIRWPEPFGLVMIEALATGTPVLTFREGAAPEIVDHGRTGYLCEDEHEMAERLASIDEIDRAACRLDAERRFSTTRMVAQHVDLYRRVIDHRARGWAGAGAAAR